MMKQASRRFLPAAFLVLVVLVSSCGSSRFYKGYAYRGSASAPDVSGETVQAPASNAPALIVRDEAVEQSAAEINLSEAQALVDQASDQPEEVKMVADATIREIRKSSVEGQEISHASLAKQVTGSLAASGQIQPLTAQQEKKLAKATAKMDRKLKQQGKEIDWKNNTGLELFFMIMAIAGLVLGIASVGFGWFVFIVFAGLWLYWKLVKD
jgi:hypothetical protein